MKPNYEIKFLINANKVLTKEKKLNNKYKKILKVSEKPVEIEVIYFDTKKLDLFQAGWTARIRKKSTLDTYEMTYKKRLQIKDANRLEHIIKEHLTETKEAFADCQSQVDWGYQKMTLSLAYSKRKEISKKRVLPNSKKLKKELGTYIPKKLDEKQLWGENFLENIETYGPIKFLRYKGQIKEQDIVIEIWPMQQYTICEVSFKVADYKAAKQCRIRVKQYLHSLGLLLPQDALKTRLVLQQNDTNK